MVFRNPFRRSERAGQIKSISALDDPIRAAVFDHVYRADTEVSRDQAAAALGVTRRVAAFHLDRLADDGWLQVTYRRLTGRTGPGAGRSSKLYRRSDRRVEVSIPARNYELMARLLASAVQQRGVTNAVSELSPGAREFGASIGGAARTRAGRNPSEKEVVSALIAELTDQGFEPVVDPAGVVRLRNCPYHDMARENTDLVCGMNLALMQGVTKGLGAKQVAATLEPHDGMCCVAFHVTGRQHPEG